MYICYSAVRQYSLKEQAVGLVVLKSLKSLGFSIVKWSNWDKNLDK